MDWMTLSLHHKQCIDEAFRRYALSLSDYTFTNLWMWNRYREYQVAFVDGFLCIKFKDNGEERHLYPFGEGTRLPIIRRLAENAKPFCMRAIPEEALAELESSAWSITPEVEHFDYVYDYQDLLQLPGNRYQSKRNFIHQFEKLYEFEYREISSNLIPEIIELETKWYEEHTERSETMDHEHEGALRLLQDFSKLNIFGGALLVDNIPIAYTIAEYTSCKMLVVHIEKALHAYKGAYSTINQQLLQHLCKVTFVNREEDLGLINLAKVKQSYHPLFLAKKFQLTIN